MTYSYDEKSLLRDGRRWFPVMGEIHYSRYPAGYWREALRKMKAGGVSIVSSYVIWIHHEEAENEWDFTGCRNLRKFVEEIKDAGLVMILRIGPWVHAEVRNGGFPDWLLKKCPRARTNDEAYFDEVRKLYGRIFSEVDGLLLKDGGPIIGVQIENEYGHCGGLTGEEGEAHMRRLLDIARDAGFDVPLYTATGWGGAVTAGLLPVMGGYCDAPWDPRTTEIEPSGNFVFTYERNDHAIGCDFGLGEGVTFDMDKVPYLTAELGGGLQPTFKRRTVSSAKDIEAMSVSKMGSGCNLLGYYMYHGGTNPQGRLTTLEENKASGSLNDLLVKNYDFRAPLGEYGHANETYRRLRRLAMFVHDYGEELCGMKTFIPPESPLQPENFSELRHSWRYDPESGHGYLFINNYQRHHAMKDFPCRLLKIPEELSGAVLESGGFPESGITGVQETRGDISHVAVSVRNGDCFFIEVSRGENPRTDLVPLCKLDGTPVYYYRERYGCDEPVSFCGGKIILSNSASLNASKILKGGKELLVISGGIVFENPSKTGADFVDEYFADERSAVLYVDGAGNVREGGLFSDADKKTAAEVPVSPEAFVEELECAHGKRYRISVSPVPSDACDVVMRINYGGDSARLYKDGNLVDDHLFTGRNIPWEIGLRRFGPGPSEFVLEIDELPARADVYFEPSAVLSDAPGETLCSLEKVTFAVCSLSVLG